MEKLFKEFEPVSKAEWVKKILADLKGKSEDILHYQAEMDLGFQSTYHSEDEVGGAFQIHKNETGWLNRKKYFSGENSRLLKDLNEGIDAIGLEFTNQSEFDALMKDVQFEYITADVTFNSLNNSLSFKGDASIRLKFDLLGWGLKNGAWITPLNSILDYYTATKRHKNLWIDGTTFGDAGATTIHELAFTANMLNELIQQLVDAGEKVENLQQNILIELAVTEDYFVNIAKFKVIRKLIDLVFSAYTDKVPPLQIPIYATTSERFLAKNDVNNNLLRQTTQAMSALIGGADCITLQYFDGANPEIMHRMSKNIPLILKEEAYLDKVEDASEGSYFMQQLCADLLSKSWSLFKQVEHLGGFCAAVEQNFIQDEISKNQQYLSEQVNSGKKTFLGINKYQSTLETWKAPGEVVESSINQFKSLPKFQVEQHFKKALHEQKDI